MMRSVVAAPLFSLSYDEELRLWRLVRTNVRASAEDLPGAFAPIHEALSKVELLRVRLLIDIRSAPFLNDPSLEVAMDRQMRRVIAGFERAAVLVKTSTGALQVNRITRQEHQDELRIFREESDAVSFLLS
jgi:hypothetical protein